MPYFQYIKLSSNKLKQFWDLLALDFAGQQKYLAEKNKYQWQ